MGDQDNGDGKKNGENADAENPEYDNFQRLLKGVLAVPKEEVDKRRREEQGQRRAR